MRSGLRVMIIRAQAPQLWTRGFARARGSRGGKSITGAKIDFFSHHQRATRRLEASRWLAMPLDVGEELGEFDLP